MRTLSLLTVLLATSADAAELRLGTTRFRSGSPVLSVTFSPDGKQLATSCADHLVRVWDAETGQVVAASDHALGPVQLVAYAPDGKSLAVTSYYRGVRVLDPASCKLRWLVQQSGGDNCLAWSPDGKWIATGGRDGGVRLIDAAEGKLVRTFTRQPGLVYAVHFTPDSKQLLSLGGESEFRRWDVASGDVQEQPVLLGLHAANRPPEGFAFSADARTLALTAPDGGVLLWDLQTGKEPRQIGGPAEKNRLRRLRFSADGSHLLAGSDEAVSLWEVAPGRVRRVWKDTLPHGPIALSQDGRKLVSVRGPVLAVWDANAWQRLHADDAPQAAVKSIAFLDSGKALVSLHADGSLHGWETAQGRLVATHSERCDAELGLGTLVGGKSIRAYSTTSMGWLDWEPGGRSSVRPWRGTLIPPLSPDGRVAVLAEATGAQLVDTATGKTARKLAEPPRHKQLYFSEDGRRFASRSGDDHLRVWEVDTGLASNPLTGPRALGHCYLPSGGRTIVQLGGVIRVWESLSGLERSRFVFSLSIAAATCTPDGRTLVVGTPEGEVLGLDLDTGKVFARRRGHVGAVRVLRFNGDGKLLGSGGDDTTVVVWDARAFRAPRPPEETLEPVQAARLWDALQSEDAERAFEAIRTLSAAGADVVPLLRAGLPVVKEDVTKKINRLVEQLDDKRFVKREAAARELLEVGPEAAPALKQLLAKEPSLDAKRRAEELLERFKSMPAGSRLRGMRGIEVLERLASAEARGVLKELASGDAEAWLTREAKAALERLRD